MGVLGEHMPSDEAPAETQRLIESSLDRLQAWVEARGYKAYDPGDGQMSFLAPLTFGVRPLERVLTAAVLRSPFNIRPWIGIRPHTSTKGMGYLACGYLWRFRATNDERYAQKAKLCLDWLVQNRSAGYSDMCWGNAFTFTTRAGRIPKGEPTIVWSSLIGQAFVDAFEVLGEERYLDVASSVCDWILKLPRETTASGACLSYVAFDQVSIHNSNMLGAGLLARVGARLDRSEAVDVARDAMLYSCSRQNADGGWYYGDDSKYHWIDSFHTGYNLDALKRYADSTKDDAFNEHLRLGYEFFKAHFIEPDGRVRYMHNRLMPIDVQCVAQTIDTLAFFSDTDPHALDLASRPARWLISHMQAPEGYFYYRDLGWKMIKTPMLHWGQGTSFKALAHLGAKLAGKVQRQPVLASRSEQRS